MSALLWALVIWGSLKLLALMVSAAQGIGPITNAQRVFNGTVNVTFGVWALCLLVGGTS